MKKTAIILSACVVFSACTKNVNDVETPQTQGTPATFAAVTEDVTDLTKTAYENSKIKWFKNDKINVMYHTSNTVEKCEFTNQADAGNMASFSGNLVGTKVAGEPFYAVYPTTGSNYDLTTDGKVKFTVTNNIQTISQGYSFAQGANYTYAASVDDDPKGGNTLYFKNAQSIIKFTVPSNLEGKENLVSVAITPNNKDCSFNGTYTCEWDTTEPTVDFVPNTSKKTVTAKNNASSGWKGGQPYYVTVPPVTYTDGIMVDLTLKDDKHIVRYNFNDFTAVRAKMHNIGTLPTTADLPAVDLSNNVYYDNTKPDDEQPLMPGFITNPLRATKEYSIVNGALKIVKTTTGGTTGYFNIKATDEAVGDYNVLRFKIRYDSNVTITNGDGKIHIRMQDNGSGSKGRVYASRVNGKSQSEGVSPVIKDGETWNIVEMDIKDLHESKTNFKGVSITVCPFASNLTTSSYNSEGNNRTCWIKDFEFIKK